MRAFALTIACEIHPLNNLRVLRYLVQQLGASEEQKNAWYRHWVEQGLAALEARVVAERRGGRHVLGDAVTAGRRRAWCRRSSTRDASIAGSITCRR